MQQVKSFSIIIFSAGLFFACSSNSSTNTNKDSASNNSVSESSGNDMYYELTTTTSGKNININGTTKMYVSSKGDMRVEMTVHNSAAGNQSDAPIILIGHSSKPHESVLIDDSAKTYTVNHFDSSDFNTGEKVQSIVTKMGEEKILGFNCVHAKIISKKTMGSFYATTDTVDVWKSNDVPMQSSVKDLMDQFESRTGNAVYSQNATQKLQQMGCSGFMVKMEMKSKAVSMTMQLTKAEHKNLDAAMFVIPAGYKEDKSSM